MKKSNEKQSADHIQLELKALDLRTGKELWSTGTLYPMHSSLFVKDGVILSAATAAGVGGLKPQAGRGEWSGPIMAFSAKDGALLWKRVVQAPISPVLINESIHLGWGWAMKLATGESVKYRYPMTGLTVPFIPRKSGGCGRLIGSSNLMMIHSGCLAFFDLTAWSGMYHYPNVRGSCWINTIPACGLVLVPDGSSACPCTYSYKTSLALAPSNRKNHWGIAGAMRGVPNNAPVNHICVNFGAPGDRPDRDGNLWYAFPRPSTKGPRGAGGMGGVSKCRLPVTMDNKIDPTRIFAVNPDRVQIRDFRRPWLYTCGLSGNATIRIQTDCTGKESRTYRITLYFNEPETDDTLRVFSVSLQGEKVMNHLNIASETGGPNRALIKRFTVKAEKEVILNLHSLNTRTSSVPILSALELEIITDSSVPTSTD